MLSEAKDKTEAAEDIESEVKKVLGSYLGKYMKKRRMKRQADLPMSVTGKAKNYMYQFYLRNMVNPSRSIDCDLPSYLRNFEATNQKRELALLKEIFDSGDYSPNQEEKVLKKLLKHVQYGTLNEDADFEQQMRYSGLVGVFNRFNDSD